MFFCRPWPREGLWAAGAGALIDAVQICQRWKSGVHTYFLGHFHSSLLLFDLRVFFSVKSQDALQEGYKIECVFFKISKYPCQKWI